MKKSFAVLLTLACVPAFAAAQTFQPGKLPATSRDSFDIVYQGQTMGAFVITVNKTGDNITMVGEARLPRMGVQETDSIVFHGTTLAPISFVNNQSMQGTSGTSRVTVANGKATGTVQRSGQSIPIDAQVAPGVIADGAEVAMLPTLDLSEGLAMTFQTFDGKQAKTKTYQVKVGARETITVPAGTFDAFKVELTSDENVTMYISADQPRKIVLVRLETAQMEMRRAK
jgi:hypothetical protein